MKLGFGFDLIYGTFGFLRGSAGDCDFGDVVEDQSFCDFVADA